VVNDGIKSRVNGINNKIKDMMIAMSKKGNILSEIGRLKSS